MTTRTSTRTGLILLIGLTALPLFARRGLTDIRDIVGKIKSLYSGTESAEIRFEQTGSTGSLSGTLLYRGDKFRLEFPKQTFVSNGEKTWTYTPATKQLVISKSAPRGSRMTPNDILNSFPGDYATELVGDDKINGRPVWVIRCVPQGNMVGDVTEATLYVDKSTYRFQQIALTSPSLGSMTLRIISAKYDTKIPDDRFTFPPPSGARVIDLSR